MQVGVLESDGITAKIPSEGDLELEHEAKDVEAVTEISATVVLSDAQLNLDQVTATIVDFSPGRMVFTVQKTLLAEVTVGFAVGIGDAQWSGGGTVTALESEVSQTAFQNKMLPRFST